MSLQRLTVREASEQLGISPDGVRMRVRRGTLESEHGEDGKVYVWVNTSPTEPNESTVQRSELVEELRDRVRSLESQLEAEREANRENRQIIAGLAQSNAELSSTMRALEDAEGSRSRQEPSEESSRSHTESPQSAEEDYEGDGPREDAEEAQTASQAPQQPSQEESRPRSWWRRIFGS